MTAPKVSVSADAPSGNGMLILIGAASLIVMVAGAFSCGRAGGWNGTGNGNAEGRSWGNEGCNGLTAFAIAAGCVSLVVCVIMVAGDASGGFNGCVADSRPYIGLFLVVWWVVSAAVITFAGPYTVVSNGYLGAWVACVGSVVYGMAVSSLVAQAAGAVSGEARKTSPAVAGLTVASAVELVAAAVFCGNCQSYVAYAVAVGAVSFFLCLVLIVGPRVSGGFARSAPWVCLFLFLWWLAAAVVLTFISPFVYAGNGYFATWVALICSGVAFVESQAPGAAQVKAAAGGH